MYGDKKDILVTGSHRSGSTWIGKVIAASPKVNYIHEPFNIHVHEEDTIFKNWFEYISDRSEINHDSEKQYINKCLHPGLRDGVKKILEAKSLQASYSKLKKLTKQRLSERQLIKDPIAVLSAEWLAKVFDLKVVVAVRHPAAFSASLKVKNWSFDFNHLLKQHYLMKDYLYPYRKDMETQVRKPGDIIDQAILLWNCINHVVRSYQKKYASRWIFVRHEDLSINPVTEYQKLFKRLNLPWNPKVEAYLNESTRTIASSEYHLSTKENIFSWKRRLTASEIARVKDGTSELSGYLYKEEEW